MTNTSNIISHFLRTVRRLDNLSNPESETYSEDEVDQAYEDLGDLVSRISSHQVTSLDLFHEDYRAVLVISWNLKPKGNWHGREPFIEKIQLVATSKDGSTDALEVEKDNPLTAGLWRLAQDELQREFESSCY